MLLLLKALRLALLLFFMLLRRALLLLVLLLRRALLLFVVPFHGFVPRAARVVVFWLYRRDRVICRRRLLHCRIVRRTTRRPRGLLCHGFVLPRAWCSC
jgi:hypothetical protein